MAIETIILTNLIHNEAYTRAVIPFIQSDYFSDPDERIVFESIKEFVNKYTVLPTKEALAIALNNKKLSESSFEGVIEILRGLNEDKDNNLRWLIDETEQYCKKAALFNAISKSIDIAEGNASGVDTTIIPGMLMDALAVSFNSDVGHNYWEDSEQHWQTMHSSDTRHQFDMPIMNKVTNGGIKDKTLNVALAPINGGKSVWLVQQASEWLMRGKNVGIISMEMDEATYRERVDVRNLDMTFNQVFALEKAQYMSRIQNIKQKTQGNLMIKEYPAGTAHAGHFRYLIQEWKIKKQFVPDVIIIDYLTICASSKLPASMRSNTNTYFTSVAEELRALAQEFGIPIWTALQLDRATQGASDAGMDNVALAIGVAATADFMFTILTPEELAALGQVIGKVIKNRYGSFKGKFIMGMNPEKQHFYEIDHVAQDVQSGDGSDEFDKDEVATIFNRKANDSRAKPEGWSFD